MAGRSFAAAGADLLCVATLDEGLRLRRVVPDRRILVLFAVPTAAVAEAAAARLELAASDLGWLTAALAAWPAASAGLPRGRELRLHLEVETGLLRAGIRPAGIAGAAAVVAAVPGASAVGLWSHLASPEDPDAVAAQLEQFASAERQLRAAGLAIPERHLAASGGLFAGVATAAELVRPGLCLYGTLPPELPLSERARAAAAALRPAMALKARPVRVEAVAPDERVGYGGTWRAERPSRIATLPLGYGDGWPRSAGGGQAQALVRGRRVPVVGTVAMDALAVEVTDVEPAVTPMDEFVLLGSQAAERISPTDLARARNTISWEVLATMAYRLPRVYHAGPSVTGLRTLAGEALTD